MTETLLFNPLRCQTDYEQIIGPHANVAAVLAVTPRYTLNLSQLITVCCTVTISKVDV